MSSLPEDLYLDILLRLPVKSLLKCKCVCKSWFELISDTSFVASHLNLGQKKDPSLILTYYHSKKKGHVISSMGYNSLISLSPTEDLYKNCVELDYPFKSPKHWVKSIGSCNGLVCLWIWKESICTGFFCVWNPATTEYKQMRNTPGGRGPGSITFGYDHMADDYILVNTFGDHDRLSVDVYTLRSNLWKNIQTDQPCNKPYTGRNGVFVNGTYHLLVQTQDHFSKFVICLDMSNEKFVELQLPDLQLPKDSFESSMDVEVLEGSLSLLVHVFGVCVEVWVMQNYGVRESWTKCHVFTHSRIANDRDLMRLMWSFKNGVILLKMGKKLVLYDTVHGIFLGKTKRLKNYEGINNHVESLVSVGSGLYLKNLNKKKKSRRNH